MCNAFPPATFKLVMQSVLSFCFKMEREGENHLSAYDYGRHV